MNGNNDHKFGEIELASGYEIAVLELFGGGFTLTPAEIGSYRFFIGYTVSGGTITYTDEPIVLNVSE